MFKWLFRLAALIAIGWFAATVPLGAHTLLGHLLAIARTREAGELAAGTKQEAAKLVEHVKAELGADAAAPPPTANQAPQETPTPAEQEELKRLVEARGSKPRKRGHDR